jgi:3-hydroxyisobutyrate dehydrogenase
MTTKNEHAKLRIGFIGLGHMGGHMVMRLIDAGYQLAVYDRTRQKAQEIAQRGANVAETPRELAASCQIVMSCVTDDEALGDVMFGQDGALAGAHKGNVFIDMSTVSPDASRHLYSAAKEKGVPVLDAAVSGSVPQVEEGSLVIFVGGDQAVYEQCKPILSVLGKQSFYIGASGMGTSMKLVVNTLLGLGLQAVAEAIILGEKSGIEKGKLLDVLGQTTVLAPAHKSKLDSVGKEEYPANFALPLMFKDFGLIMKQAETLAVPMPATAAAHQMYAAAMAKGMEEDDYSVVIKFMEQLAGLSRQKT